MATPINLPNHHYSNIGVSESMGVSPRHENRELLLTSVMKKLKITDEDMNRPGFIKEKLREINLDILLS